jgi:hypothetical protein
MNAASAAGSAAPPWLLSIHPVFMGPRDKPEDDDG